MSTCRIISILIKIRKPSTNISDSLEIALSDLGRYQAFPFWSGFSVWERIAEIFCENPIFRRIKLFEEANSSKAMILRLLRNDYFDRSRISVN